MIKYTVETLIEAVNNTKSVMGVLKWLDIPLTTSNHRHISKRIQDLKIDTSHFLGLKANSGLHHKGGSKKLSALDILVLDRFKGRRDHAVALRRALLEIDIEEKCEICGLKTVWNNKSITLQIDHINGNGLDNRKENLRFLCPNCHSQTDNFGIKNKK